MRIQTSSSISQAFAAFTHLYPKWNMILASGIPEDVGKISDVDIAIYYENHRKLKWSFREHKINYSKLDATIYSTTLWDREVNIFVTSNPVLAYRGAIYRARQDAMRRECPILYRKVRRLKMNGMKTVDAWMAGLNLSGDPYEMLLLDHLDRAKRIERRLKYIEELSAWWKKH